MTTTKIIRNVMAAFLAATGLVLNADALDLINEDFQIPMYANGTALVDGNFTGWKFVSGPKAKDSDNNSDIPCDDYPSINNQVVHFEWTDDTASYDTSHGWATNEGYTLTVNVSPQSWNGTLDRYFVPRLLQTDNTLLWTETRMIPKYNNFGHNPWTAEQTFTFVIWGSQISSGTPGQPLRLKLASSGQRGIFIDNVTLTSGAPPVDSTAPTPDPLGWEVVPVCGDYGYITMKAELASDAAGVEYFFTNTVRGTSSGWQLSRTWNEGGLNHGALYTYRVKARDLSPNKNETAWSVAKDVSTWPVENGTIIITGFQCPAYNDGTTSPYFEGWTFSSPGQTYIRQSPGDGVPGGPTNRVVQFSQLNITATYDTDHAWASGDIYDLTVNAAPQDWSGSYQRYLDLSLRQTDNTELWSTKETIPLAASFGGVDPWPSQLTFTYRIIAREFEAGSKGELLRLVISSSGAQRGVFFDNVLFTKQPPLGMVLLVL